MSVGIITSGLIPGKSGPTALARLRGANGALITQASVASIPWAVQDLNTGLLVASGTLTVSSVIFDTLQTDAIWTKDSILLPGPDGSTGYNFKNLFSATLFVPGGDTYQIDVQFVPFIGEPVVQSWKMPTFRVYV